MSPNATISRQNTAIFRGEATRSRLRRRDPLAPYPRCRCGLCRQCLDNAKWDRIFAKFAVSEYGEERGLFQSPLRDL